MPTFFDLASEQEQIGFQMDASPSGIYFFLDYVLEVKYGNSLSSGSSLLVIHKL